jgi:hypothetical protein
MKSKLFICGLLLASICIPASAVDDVRWCGPPARDAKNVIIRSGAEVRKFVKVFPCPANLKHSRTCKGWDVDHIIPLASGGCDKPVNMQWLPNTAKNCTSSDCKDRWERTYHDTPRRRVLP